MIKVGDGVQNPSDGLRVVMVGPTPPPVGGATVSFEALYRFLVSRSCNCIVIDTVRRRGGKVVTALGALWHLIKALRNCDVVTAHFSDQAAVTIAPIMWTICRLAGKPFVFRQFGGEFDQTFATLPKWIQFIVARTILRSDAVFLQTKAMMSAFAPFSSSLHWFPTARINHGSNYRGGFANGEHTKLRCLFLGHVSKAKGILVAAQAVKAVPSVVLDVYGPLVDIKESDFVSECVQYRGIADPDQVTDILARYDVLLFPTSHRGEGYSGTLVEAAMAGLPMIVSRWQSLPEMFADDEAIFIDSACVDQLVVALRTIIEHPKDLQSRSRRLIKRSVDFDADIIFGHFLAICFELMSQRRA